MHRTRKSDSYIAILATLFLSVHLVILSGLTIRGILNALHAHGVTDALYGALLGLLGMMFAAISVRATIPYLKDGAWSMLRTVMRRHKKILLIVGTLTILQYLFRTIFFNTLTHGGVLFGGYVLGQSRLGLLGLTGIDLFDYGFEKFAWVMQFYLLLLIAGWIRKSWKTKNRL